MNHLVVRNLFNAVKELADYIDKEDIRGHVAYAVGMNVNILEAEVKVQTSGAPKRLREIEEKIILEGSEAFKSLSDEDKANFKTDQAIKTRIMILGKEKLSDEEKDEYQKSLEEFQIFLKEESKVKLYMMDADKLSESSLNLKWMLFCQEWFVPKKKDKSRE